MAVAKMFTPELIANGRYRYEQTDEPVASIAASFGITRRTLDKYVHKWGWTPRGDRPPIGLSPLDCLLEQAKDMPAMPIPTEAPAEGAVEAASQQASCEAATPAITMDERAVVVERMWRAVQAELTAVERMRAQYGEQPQRPVDAERTARTLESIMRTVREVDRLRFAVASPAGRNDDDYDDMPRDLDEFRRELARRIENFVRSRTGTAVSERAADGEGVEPSRT